MKKGKQKVNLGWCISLIYFCLSKMVGWARVCYIVPFCLALDNPKVESAKSNLKDPVASHQTLCFRAMKRNSLCLFSWLSCSPSEVTVCFSCGVFFLLGTCCWTNDKGQYIIAHIFSRIYVFNLKPLLPVCVYFVCMPTLGIHVEALNILWCWGPGSRPPNSSGPLSLRIMLWLVGTG